MSFFGQLHHFDNEMVELINGNLAVEMKILLPVMIGLTILGNVLVLLVIVSPLLWKDGRRKEIFIMLGAAILGNICAAVIKYIVARPRPPDTEEFFYLSDVPAFPSGHTVNAFVICTILMMIYRNRWPLFCLLGGFIGFSRLWLGAHYPTDILAGAILGMAIGYTFFLYARTSTMNARLEGLVNKIESWIESRKAVTSDGEHSKPPS